MLELYEIGQKCPTHPEAALVATQTPYRYNCSECKRIEEENATTTELPNQWL